MIHCSATQTMERGGTRDVTGGDRCETRLWKTGEHVITKLVGLFVVPGDCAGSTPNTLPSCMTALALNYNRMSWMENGPFSGLELLLKRPPGSMLPWRPCWYPWPVLPLEAKRKFVVCVPVEGHVDVHNPCCCWGPCWCL